MSKIIFINGKSECGCKMEFSDGHGEYSDVHEIILCNKHKSYSDFTPPPEIQILVDKMVNKEKTKKELLQSSHETFQQDKKDKDHNTTNDKHPLYLHKYKSVNHKVQHQYHQVHARYYDKLEDIPRPHLPNDDQMFDESIYELTPVPLYIVNEVKRKKREDAEYKRYLELKAKFEKLNKDTE